MKHAALPPTEPAPEPTPAPAPAPAAARMAQPLGATVTLASVGVAALFALAGAAAISPWFKTPFVIILGRTLLLALVLLLAFAAAQRWPERWLPRWLPRWVLAGLAVGVAAPLTTLLIYLAAVGGSVQAFLASMPHIWGFWITGATALGLGLVVTLTAQLRRREADARARELQFALERSRLERQAVDARLALLQAQIEPHFLFNTLANVQALVEAGSPRAPAVLKSLIAYLRAAMPSVHAGPTTLAEELARVRAYLALMQMRMPDRLRFAVEAEPALMGQRFPAMALLTLVENAVRHGIDPLEQGGQITVAACRRGAEAWEVTVADDGAGIDPHATPGTGLANLRERLQGFYGPGAALQLDEVAPQGVRARIVVQGLA